VHPYPLVRQDAPEVAGLVAIVRRLAIARTISEVMQITTQAARSLLHADGVTFVLRDGDLCYYAEEDAVSPLWKGRRFPMGACISGWCMTEENPLSFRTSTQTLAFLRMRTDRRSCGA
jgi:hypothetical protein